MRSRRRIGCNLDRNRFARQTAARMQSIVSHRRSASASRSGQLDAQERRQEKSTRNRNNRLSGIRTNIPTWVASCTARIQPLVRCRVTRPPSRPRWTSLSKGLRTAEELRLDAHVGVFRKCWTERRNRRTNEPSLAFSALDPGSDERSESEHDVRVLELVNPCGRITFRCVDMDAADVSYLQTANKAGEHARLRSPRL